MNLRRGLLVTLAVVAGTTLLMAPAAGAAKGKKKSGVFKVVSATASSLGAVEPGPLSATATCPAGRAVSGGFEVFGVAPATQAPAVIESSRVGQKGWRATFLPTNSGQTVLAEVYCGKLKGSISTASGTQQLGAAESATANPVATCPRGRQLISGGFQTALGAPGPATAFATQNRLVDKGVWQVGFLRGVAVGTPDQLTAFAYCLKPPKPKKRGKPKKVLPRFLTQVSATGQAPLVGGGETTLTAPRCPGKRRGVAGGFLTPLTFDSAPAIQQARFLNGVWSLRVKQLVVGPVATSFEAKGYCG